jgi:hypothetical protein
VPQRSGLSRFCPEYFPIEISKAKNEPTKSTVPTVCDGRRTISADSINLAPGPTLTRWLPDEDDTVVGEEEGSLENEAKSPVLPITMKAGVILFMPKDEPYHLKNVGKKSLYIQVIRMRATTTASQ